MCFLSYVYLLIFVCNVNVLMLWSQHFAKFFIVILFIFVFFFFYLASHLDHTYYTKYITQFKTLESR